MSESSGGSYGSGSYGSGSGGRDSSGGDGYGSGSYGSGSYGSDGYGSDGYGSGSSGGSFDGDPSYGNSSSGGGFYGSSSYGSPSSGSPSSGASDTGSFPGPASANGAYGASPSYGEPSYGGPQGGSMPSYTPAPRKRGMKRIVFGILGILANGIGLIAMPMIGAFVGAMFAVSGADSTALDPQGGTLETKAFSAYDLYVPRGEENAVQCTLEGNAELEHESTEGAIGMTVDGTSYVKVYGITATEDGTQTVTCEGASSLQVTSTGLVGVLVGTGLGLVIPIVLGIAAIILLIWGLVVRLRSS